jgi:hypothetical protein
MSEEFVMQFSKYFGVLDIRVYKFEQTWAGATTELMM